MNLLTLILLLIAVFIIGMFAGSLVLALMALKMDKKEKDNGGKKENL